jgi:hypothetical protein
MFCPQCKSEFREGFVRCARCDKALIDALPPEPQFVHFSPTVVFTSSNIHEAHLVKSLLEGGGLKVVVFDAEMSSLNPFFTNVVGGIKLAVDEGDRSEAEELLREFRSQEGQDPSSGALSPWS